MCRIARSQLLRRKELPLRERNHVRHRRDQTIRPAQDRGADDFRHALARRTTNPARRWRSASSRPATRRRRARSSPTTSRRSAPSVKAWIADPAIDVIITTGGTGFTGRDVTPEAVEPLFEKRMDGFSTLFLMLSYAKIGTSTIQSRATAGVAGATYIFCLPGSPGACQDAWDDILVHQLDYRTRPCNFVEIMPRLDEHLRRPKARTPSG